MIAAGTSPVLYIDWGEEEPGMTLQYRVVKNGQFVWLDYVLDGERVLSPVDIGELPFGDLDWYRKEPPVIDGSWFSVR